MSANIAIGKLKFSLFGHGYDDTRVDSGDGSTEELFEIPFGARMAAIDSTGQFAWLANSSGVKKYDLTDLSEVSQSILTDGVDTAIFHPTNIANNYGIAFQNNTVTVFDLTNDTIIKTGAASYSPMNPCDCIIDGNTVYFGTVNQGRTNNKTYTLDITTLSMTETSFNNMGVCGFANKNLLMAYYIPEWYYQFKRNYGIDRAGNAVWYVDALTAGGPGFPKCNQIGFASMGKMYRPSYVFGAWRMGVYGPNGGDFETPKPIKTFGRFPAQPQLYTNNQSYAVAHNTGRTKVAFATSLGVYKSDYHDLTLMGSTINYPVALDDNTLLARDETTVKTFVYRSS